MTYWEDYAYKIKIKLSKELRYLWQRLYLPKWRTDYYNKMHFYDGMTINDFYRGRLISFLLQLGVLNCPGLESCIGCNKHNNVDGCYLWYWKS